MSALLSRPPPAGFIEPCLPSPVDTPPAGTDWFYEIDDSIARMVDAIAEGTGGRALNTKLGQLESEREKLIEEKRSVAVQQAPELHPNLPELYRRRVVDLEHAAYADSSGTGLRERDHSLADFADFDLSRSGVWRGQD